jgi:hypothetical protein
MILKTSLLKPFILGVAVTATCGNGWSQPPSTATANAKVSLERPADALPDASDLVPWPVKPYPVFDAASVVRTDKAFFDAPAGKHGFVQAQPDGSLAFEDKTLVRFWGTTTAYAMTFPDKEEEIPILADAIAASGYNLVRFHHNDIPWGGYTYLQTKPVSNYALDPVAMDKLDKLASELFKRGVYIYVDLVDSRVMTEAEGFEDWKELAKVGGEGWKGLFPHPKIVEAWKKATTALLSHKNPYTGRTWAQEPGIATVEVINENGTFWDWGHKINDSIRAWRNSEWNGYLLKKYGSREKLDAAWTDYEGKKGLYTDEDPAKNNIFMPPLTAITEWDRPYRSKTRGAARVNDFYEMLATQNREFFQLATKHLRDMGYKGIVLGGHELQGVTDQKAIVDGGGSVGAHLYAGGDNAWNARPTTKGAVIEGVDVKTNNWFSNIPRIKVRGVPGINGEWTGFTLTRRADANLAVATVTAFQGVDQSLHFTYSQRASKVPLPAADKTFEYLNYLNKIDYGFSVVHDDSWMAVNRVASALFARGDFAKPKYSVDIAYSAEDIAEQNLHAGGINGGAITIGGAATFLPMIHNVESAYFDKQYSGDADITWMTGRSASGDYSKAKHAVLVGDNAYNDRQHKSRDIGVPAKFVNPKAKVVTLSTPVTFTVKWPYVDARTLSYESYEGAIESATIPKGAQVIGLSTDGKYSLGWLDDRFLVLPNGRAYAGKIRDVQWLFRLYLAAAKRWKIDTADNAVGSTFYRADTREWTTDWATGTIIVDTPRTQGFSGFMGWRDKNETRNLSAKIDLPYGNVLASSMDNQPLSTSKRVLLVASARVQNTGQTLGKNKDGKLDVTDAGKAPLMVEALRGQISFASSLASSLMVYALDSEGRRLGKVDATVQNGRVNFALSPKWGTLWFELATPDISGPATLWKTAWPLEEKPRNSAPSVVPFLAANEFFDAANGKALASTKTTAASTPVAAETRLVARDYAVDKFAGAYGNAKATVVDDAAKGRVLRMDFGKVNDQNWFGGVWHQLTSPAGARDEDGVGLSFSFKGNGSAPPNAFLSLKTTNGAEYRSKDVRSLFENDAWQDVLLKPEDFTLADEWKKKNVEAAKTQPATPDWGQINRFDFNVGGAILGQEYIGYLAAPTFVLKSAPVAPVLTADALHASLPKTTEPATAKIKIPLVTDAKIVADGKLDEAVWKQAIGLAMNENKVPAWHFFGSHIVDGRRMNDESANFWMLGTNAGLALVAEVQKGTPDIVNDRADWFLGDAVEVFADAPNKGEKPTVQLFLAPRRPALDRPAASIAAVQIGRARLENGYVLESLIPWSVLGFTGVPTDEFGLEFQVDFGGKDQGRVLQMLYTTGTNEAWIKADRYLKATVG